jgi:hypothetical protein
MNPLFFTYRYFFFYIVKEDPKNIHAEGLGVVLFFSPVFCPHHDKEDPKNNELESLGY